MRRVDDATDSSDVNQVAREVLEIIETRDGLAFAGIERSQVRLPANKQLAETVHAYTLRRGNSQRRIAGPA